MKYFVVVVAETLMILLFKLPRFKFLNCLKSVYLRSIFRAEVGKRVVFYSGVWIFTGRNLFLGDDVDLAEGVLITTDGGVYIGDRVLVGYRTCILSSNHRVPLRPEPIFSAGHVRKPVHIESDVWIGANCTILPGVTIGSGAIVAAGSVVTKDVEPYSIVAGVPARKVRDRE